jgi:hypothetical protein
MTTIVELFAHARARGAHHIRVGGFHCSTPSQGYDTVWYIGRGSDAVASATVEQVMGSPHHPIRFKVGDEWVS